MLWVFIMQMSLLRRTMSTRNNILLLSIWSSRPTTIKKNATQNKSKTQHARAFEVTSFLSTDCELSTETCSKNVYSLGPRFMSRHDSSVLMLLNVVRVIIILLWISFSDLPSSINKLPAPIYTHDVVHLW